VTADRPPGPWVGDTVWDTAGEEWVTITDVRQRDVPRPVYVLRPAIGGPDRWTTTNPRRLRADGPE
jgi:hypothetical protein